MMGGFCFIISVTGPSRHNTEKDYDDDDDDDDGYLH
jgi:hypothetical protein